MAGDVQPTLICLTPPSHVPMCRGRSPPHTGCVGEDPPLPLVAVRDSLTPLVVLSTTRCVGGSSAINWEIQMLSLVLDCQLTPTMSMESVSHMAPPANTSGHSLMVLMSFPQVTPMQHAPVLLRALMDAIFLHSWVRTTSVRQA